MRKRNMITKSERFELRRQITFCGSVCLREREREPESLFIKFRLDYTVF